MRPEDHYSVSWQPLLRAVLELIDQRERALGKLRRRRAGPEVQHDQRGTVVVGDQHPRELGRTVELLAENGDSR